MTDEVLSHSLVRRLAVQAPERLAGRMIDLLNHADAVVAAVTRYDAAITEWHASGGKVDTIPAAWAAVLAERDAYQHARTGATPPPQPGPPGPLREYRGAIVPDRRGTAEFERRHEAMKAEMNRTWVPGEFTGRYLIFTTGALRGQGYRVTGNTKTQLTIDPLLAVAPAADDNYVIF